MGAPEKLDLLGNAARFDLCSDQGACGDGRGGDLRQWISYAIRADGKRVPLLKVLQSNVCENDCAYCAFRSGRDTPRSAFTPDELAHLLDQMVQRRLVEGLFLSSGVCGNVARATERMLATVELVRKRYAFAGYVHLKILPGADEASVLESVKLAQRVSVNMEAPGPQRIGVLSQAKVFPRLLHPLREAHRVRAEADHPVSMTTQFVVGAAEESDREILSLTAELYRELHLARTYFSAFRPIRGTPLEDREPTPGWREHRLYQADFLLRQYGYRFDELIFDDRGHLPRGADPKRVWAHCHPASFPVEANTASREMLMRIPGIGPRGADTILRRRRQGRLRTLQDLGLRSNESQVAPWVLLDGHRPEFQLTLWDVPEETREIVEAVAVR